MPVPNVGPSLSAACIKSHALWQSPRPQLNTLCWELLVGSDKWHVAGTLQNSNWLGWSSGSFPLLPVRRISALIFKWPQETQVHKAMFCDPGFHLKFIPVSHWKCYKQSHPPLKTSAFLQLVTVASGLTQTLEFSLYSWEESEDRHRNTQFKLPLLLVPLTTTSGRAAPLPHVHTARAATAPMLSWSFQHHSPRSCAPRGTSTQRPQWISTHRAAGLSAQLCTNSSSGLFWDKQPSHKETAVTSTELLPGWDLLSERLLLYPLVPEGRFLNQLNDMLNYHCFHSCSLAKQFAFLFILWFHVVIRNCSEEQNLISSHSFK